MSEKQPTQSMGSAKSDAPTGENDGLVPKDTRGAGGGGPLAKGRQDREFRGGQSEAAYHGSGQLGEEAVKKGGNANSGSRQS